MKNTVVICTRNRNKSVLELLSSLNVESSKHEMLFLVVENSESEQQFVELQQEILNLNFKNHIQIIKSAPGLATSRNLALNQIDDGIVHFLDDDVVVPTSYFDEACDFFGTNQMAVGVAPYIRVSSDIENSLKNRIRNTLIKLLKKQGKFTKSGRAHWLVSKRVRPVDWLPGCCMSYRMEAIKDLDFSEELQNGPLGGYALGEDFDFSHRALQMGELWGLGSSTVFHKLEPNDRSNWKKMDEGIGRWLAYVHMKYPREVKSSFVVSGLILDGVRKILFGSDGYPKSDLRKFLRLHSYFSELENPKLTSSTSRNRNP